MKRVWLEKISEKRGLTHFAVAEHVGIDRAYFTQIVSGKRRPSPGVAQKNGTMLDFDWTIFLLNRVAKRH